MHTHILSPLSLFRTLTLLPHPSLFLAASRQTRNPYFKALVAPARGWLGGRYTLAQNSREPRTLTCVCPPSTLERLHTAPSHREANGLSLRVVSPVRSLVRSDSPARPDEKPKREPRVSLFLSALARLGESSFRERRALGLISIVSLHSDCIKHHDVMT